MSKVNLENLKITGVQVNYFLVCPRKLWLFSKNLNMEQTSDLVYLGRLIDKESYKREIKNIIIDNKVQIDFFKRTLEVHEIKKSKKLDKPHFYQLLYYLYYLKQKGIIAKGIINYPLSKRIEKVELTQEKEKEIEKILDKIEEVLKLKIPPPLKRKPYCRKCSYYFLCFA